MNAVGGDQQRSLGVGPRLASAALDESRANTGRGFLPPGQVMTGLDRVHANPFASGFQQEHLQFAAMDGELRPTITSALAARFSPDALTVTGIIRQLGGRDPRRRQSIA